MCKYDNIVFLNRLILQFLHSSDKGDGHFSNSMLFQLMPIIADFDSYSLDSTSAFIAFIVKLKKITKTCISDNKWKTFNAKLVIQKNYNPIDNKYVCHMNWLRVNKNVNINEKMDAKYHETSIDSIIELSNGDIAVSGGPLNFEVLIYRNQLYNEYEASSHY